MLLSEAIRLGAMQGPQIRGHLFGPNDSSCALGAAAIGIGATTSGTDLIASFPGLTNQVQLHSMEPAPLESTIIFLNDCLCWSRQDIADWIVANGYDCESVDLSVNVNTEQRQETVCV